jgi:hypothetical protein
VQGSGAARGHGHAGRSGAAAAAGRALALPALAVSPEQEVAAASPGGPVIETFGPGAQPDEVALVGRRIIERRRLQRETGIIGETEAMHEVLERVVQIAPTQATGLGHG